MWEYDGIQGKNWFWADKGAKGIDGEQALFRDVQWPAPQGQSWNQYATMYRSLDFRNGQRVDPKAPTLKPGFTRRARSTNLTQSRRKCSCRR